MSSTVTTDRRITSDPYLVNRISELERRIDKIDFTQSNAVRDLDEHDKEIKAVTQVAVELKHVVEAFKLFIDSQKETNKIVTEGLKKSTDFQSRFIVGGSIMFVMWQMFGSKLFTLFATAGVH
jgi:hypothetical protein